MIRNINTPKQFAVSQGKPSQFKPEKEEPKTVHIYLNSQNRISGSTREATFKVNLPCEFKTNKLNVSLQNFILNYPTNTAGGIIAVHMGGLDALHTFSSFNKNTHRTLGVFAIDEGRALEYPPAPLTGISTNITGQSYGNGTYTIATSSFDFPQGAFNKDDGSTTQSFNTYNYNNGFPTAGTTTNVGGFTIFGEWIDLIMPSSIRPSSYSMNIAGGSSRIASEWTIAGSRDNGTSWDLLHFSPYQDRPNWTNMVYGITTDKTYNRFRIIISRSGNTFWGEFRETTRFGELRIYGYSTQITQPQRVGQVKLNSEILTTDKTIFNRPITMCLTSPSGTDISGIGDWSCHISVSEMK